MQRGLKKTTYISTLLALCTRVSQLTGLVILLLVVLTRPVHSQERDWMDWQDPAYIEKAFMEIAFKSEYRHGVSTLGKWNRSTPIRYQFIYQQTARNPMIESLFQAHLDHLVQITSQPIERNDQYANLKIILTQDRLYKKAIREFTHSQVENLERDSHCMASYQRAKNGEIRQAVVILPVDHVFSRGLLASCVVEETTQIMGLPNDSDWVTPSIANDSSQLELLSGLDYIFLKILYNRGLKAGMDIKQSRKIIQQIIHTLQKNGTIKAAETQVKTHGLYRLLN
ncbi:DUF2927 domain-containing protein [Thiomicrorhabdus sp. zzn3]|uniref:DUF2927 domain-containing protein n=1 Tax=Thiomicrorhabdus sp. zzn3 TaxID=3039775 RepID=UPI0024373118|nr:DUF2927 domain-containing protein [Thiomicrorhabdus sp. zzn3]MDG6779166.1 DUF2927 domain-containing protein [Thiomicrorhabdus sp. zzn3]